MTNRTKNLMFATFALFAVVLIAGLGSSFILFEDDFETNGLSQWEVSGAGELWEAVEDDQNSNTGQWYAEAIDTTDPTTLETTIDTSGYENIVFSYYRQLGGGWEDTDEFRVLWSIDGITFETPLEEVIDGGEDEDYFLKIWDLPAEAENNPDFKIKFECTTSAQGEFCNLDDIKVEGDAIPDVLSLFIASFTAPTESVNGTLILENNGNVDLTNIVFTTNGNVEITFNPQSISSLLAEAQSTISLIISNLDDLKFGSNPTTITATSAEGPFVTTNTFNIEKTFCKDGSQGGDLVIDRIDFDNLGEGDDDEDWELLDVIEVKVRVENNNEDENIDEVFVELAIFDSNGVDQTNDFDFLNNDEEKIDLGKIRDGEDKTATFEIRIPADVDEDNYKIAIKAYSKDLGEEIECDDDSSDLDNEIYEAVSVERESDDGRFIAFEDITVNPTPVSCGERVTLSADIFNIGDEDQDQVKITLRNSELGLSEFIEIRSDLDQGDKESVSFEFTIPSNVEEKSYVLKLGAEYDYDNGHYDLSLDDEINYLLSVVACSGVPSVDRIGVINAVLDSDAEAGEELVVIATITNLKNERASFIIDAVGYQSWASLDDISQRILDLEAGESREVVFTFTVKEDAEGEESFEIEMVSEGVTESREISVNIDGASTVRSGLNFGDNAYLWIIGIVNVVLILLIIVVAVRVSRR